MKLVQVVVGLALAITGSAYASVINVATAFSNAGFQTSATDYKNVVDNALASASAGYGSTQVASYDNLSNQSLFGGSATNIAFKANVAFGLTTAGLYEFRAGVDFGRGGAFFLDGVALGFKTNDMWWAGSYTNPSQYFNFSSALASGNHQITLYGLEGCCDGGQQMQFKAAGASSFSSFSNNDGLNLVAVSEPAPYAMALLGFGLFGFKRRRNAG